MNPGDSAASRAFAAELVRRGQAWEAQGSPGALTEALRAYESAIARMEAEPASTDDAARHQLGVAWMNRGNVLTRQDSKAALEKAVDSYDRAIALVRSLPIATDPTFRNCLGAAWLNRGHALFQLGDAASLSAAYGAYEEAIALLRALPLDSASSYRVNLAGALINLANALCVDAKRDGFERARELAREGLVLVSGDEDHALEFADLALKAQRAQCEALGQLLFFDKKDAVVVASRIAEASDAVDAGLALARRWERRGVSHFHRLAARLFRFGVQLYERYQPQFLAEFVGENLDPTSAPASWSNDTAWLNVAADAVGRARAALAIEPILNLAPSALSKLRETSLSLTRVEQKLDTWRTKLPSPPTRPSLSSSVD